MGSPKEPPELRVHVFKLTVVKGNVLPSGDHMSSHHQTSSLSVSEGIGIVQWSPDMFGATGEIFREFWIYYLSLRSSNGGTRFWSFIG